MNTDRNGKKAVKVSYQGETKRLKLSADYGELLERTGGAFKNLPVSFKFFYLDEDNEIISISSQSDFTEALDIEDFSMLRLTIATNVTEARNQLLVHLEEHRPLAESLNSSQVLSQRHSIFSRQSMPRDIFMAAESDFDSISHQELAQSIIGQKPLDSNVQHEIAVGSDDAMCESVSIGTEVMPTAVRADTGCNTAVVQTSEKMIDTCVQMCDMSSQVKTKTQDQGCDGIVTQMQNQASQMVVQVKDCDVTCDLLIPSDDSDAEELEEVACIKCNGSQMNKKGLPCRKCNGRGTLVSRELSAMATIIRQEVSEYCHSSFKKMFEDYLEQKQLQQNATVHEKIACDGCDVNPIRGIRYMCSVCADTDFCSTCMRNGVHSEHALLKIRKPEQAPAKLICQFFPKGRVMQPTAMRQNFKVDTDAHGWERDAPPQKQVRYSARFVKESFPDKHEIICNDEFAKSWWMRNDGETAWPAGTQLVQTSGDDIHAKIVTIMREVPAGETFEFSVQCKAPEKEGRYTAFFRLQTGRIKFGHKVNCDILCVHPVVVEAHEEMKVEPESEILAPATIKAPEPVEMIAQDIVIAPKDKKIAEPERLYQEEDELSLKADDEEMESASSTQPSSALMSSMVSIEAKTPRQLYFEQVEAETIPYLKESLTNLYESGFTNFKVNKTLLLKYKDVNAVANQILSGALSESQFSAVLN